MAGCLRKAAQSSMDLVQVQYDQKSTARDLAVLLQAPVLVKGSSTALLYIYALGTHTVMCDSNTLWMTPLDTSSNGSYVLLHVYTCPNRGKILTILPYDPLLPSIQLTIFTLSQSKPHYSTSTANPSFSSHEQEIRFYPL